MILFLLVLVSPQLQPDRRMGYAGDLFSRNRKFTKGFPLPAAKLTLDCSPVPESRQL
eukprot:c45285_g1_i1 orf=133-303(+)